MEPVLETYAAGAAGACEVICLDESAKELQDHVRPPIPGDPTLEDPEYRRNGQVSLFLAYAPFAGWHTIAVTETRTSRDFAAFLRDLVAQYPRDRMLTIVLDNLNTHSTTALYQAFPPSEATRIRDRVTFVKTPVHGSWLNMAELEFSVLKRQCLNRRIPDRETLAREVDAWVSARNAVAAPAHWTFTTTEARTTLARLYPVPEPSAIPPSENTPG
jgi:hypothetical protein